MGTPPRSEGPPAPDRAAAKSTTGEHAATTRDQTDRSLQGEREHADRGLSEKRAAEEIADLVVDRARDDADAVLARARSKADQAIETPSGAAVHDVSHARTLEDDVLAAERASADERLRVEREESHRLLVSLLPLEREKTDRFLLTERVRSDHALAQRDDFLGMVSHDLRNLLGGIVMSAGIVSGSSAADQPGEVLVGMKRIQRYAARMNRLIGDLLDVVSLDSGTLAISRAPVDVAAIVAEAADAFRDAAAAKGIALQVECGALPAVVQLDHDRILQVLANLLSNSLKFTPRGGTVTLDATADGASVRVSVVDSGCGIAPELLESIFERFWQVGKNDRRGVGLGLYISRCIVEAHGGEIHADSEPGQGTTLSFALPLTAIAP
jgi:signal transduction histidine kinase